MPVICSNGEANKLRAPPLELLVSGMCHNGVLLIARPENLQPATRKPETSCHRMPQALETLHQKPSTQQA